MSASTNNSLSEEMNKSYDSSNFSDSVIEKEVKALYYNEEKKQKKRKISKISLKLEELKNKINPIEENNLDLSEDDLDIDLNENVDNYLTLEKTRKENIFSTFIINFSFVFNKKEFLITIESDVFNINQKNVRDLIKNTINKINEKNIIFQYNKIKYIISLKDNEDSDFYKTNYELRAYDINNFSVYPFDLSLSDIKETKLNFVSKNCLNIMIRKL